MSIRDTQNKKYWDARSAGFSISQSAQKAKISESTAYRLEKAKKNLTETTYLDSSSRTYREDKKVFESDGPIPLSALNSDAKRALEDFTYFRRRYFGRVSTPWQEEAGLALVKLVESPEKEYVVMNMPPGSGKTTILHDVICWLICRNRSVRLLVGGATATNAQRTLMRVRRSLERVIPEVADDNLKARGQAFDAETTLSADFGRFKPLDKELWTNQAFIVMQPEESGAISEKEPTLTAVGADTAFLGGRFDGCFWDDLVNTKATRSAELKEKLEELYDSEIETRLEPSGMLALIGQRLGPDDIYRHALDMVQPLEDEDEDDEELVISERRDKKYKHLIYKAHYEDRCKPEFHKKNAPAYPEGCLLDPRRLSWRELSNIQANRGARFAVVYQQEDIALDEVLVRKEWIYGDSTYLGCIDKDRDRWEIPLGLSPANCLAVATADPSPTNYWSIQFWIYDPGSNQRFLIDMVRKKMDAPDFLEYRVDTGGYVGVMEEWQALSEKVGFPIQYWIVEQNAAQRFMLQYDVVKRWAAARNVEILPHNTGRNKSDEDLGVTTISEHYKFGRVRLPGRGDGKTRSLKLIDEVTTYPHGRTDDCVMAHWFFEWNLPNLDLPNVFKTQAWRPKWVKQTQLTRFNAPFS